MGFYRQVIFPKILHRVMRNPEANEHRGRVVPAASGRVLEIGIGSGLNLPYYSDQVEALVGLDPSQPMLDILKGETRTPAFLEKHPAQHLGPEPPIIG